MDYFKKYEKNPYQDLEWNIPEQKQGSINIIGGHVGGFRTEVKLAEYLTTNYPVAEVYIVLPDVLQGKLPPIPGIEFLKSTDTGSLADSEELTKLISAADYNILSGDLSKNAITGRAVASACKSSARPLLITRDAVDVVAENMADTLLMNANLVFLGSVAQIIKVLKAVYYPKILLMTQPLMQVAEVLHKFTLSYPTAIITLAGEQILIAKDGMVAAVPLENSGYSPLSLWSGELAAKIAIMNTYSPEQFIGATVAAIYHKK